MINKNKQRKSMVSGALALVALLLLYSAVSATAINIVSSSNLLVNIITSIVAINMLNVALTALFAYIVLKRDERCSIDPGSVSLKDN